MAFSAWRFLNLLQVALISDALTRRLAVGISLNPSSSKMSFPWAARTSMAQPIPVQWRAKNSINGSSPIQSPRGARTGSGVLPWARARWARSTASLRKVVLLPEPGPLIARRA